SYDLLDQAAAALGAAFDRRHAGFGPAPKFPPHGPLLLLAREYARTGHHQLLDMLEATLDAMARGGIRDHLAGGFHRYSTDDKWLLPHFEKMLYDNAQLITAYVEGYRLTGREAFRDVALQAGRWILTEMTDPAGGFYCALDADSENHEGLFYLWPHDELVSVLGRQAAAEFAAAYGARPEGNFADEAGGVNPETNILHLPHPLDETARQLGVEPPALAKRLADAREKLLAARNRRVHPGCDDKVLAAWNALAISGLAFAGKALAEPAFIAAAQRAAEFILHSLFHDGRLLRSWRAGQTRPGACLDDYAFLAAACLDLHAATGDDLWLARATTLSDTMTALFADPEAGGFFFTPADRTDLPYRLKDPFDQATPSGNAVAVSVLVRLSVALSDPARLALAERTLQTFLGFLEQAPAATTFLLLSASDYLAATHAP
ncbi:MAG: AGE family epimerase/isomerase, partial [Planctomycetota bacterium]|nr:AGE family epimerase/isomerase [Planctomycetota bacterium]